MNTFTKPAREHALAASSNARRLRVAYLVNQYPKISHAWIFREIKGVEACGIDVERISIRAVNEPLVNAEDAAERARTRVVLSGGLPVLIWNALKTAIARPVRFASALRTALRMGASSHRGLVYHLVYLAEACLCVRWLREAEIDHVHAHFGSNSATVAALCHALGGPSFSFTVHGPELSLLSPFGEFQEKIERCEFLIAISHHGRSQMFRDARPQNWKKMHLVHCGVDETFLAAEPAPLPARTRFVCVARLSPEKGHVLLVEAAHVLAEEGYDFEIALVGDGDFRPTVEKHVRRFGLEERVRILGWMGTHDVCAQIQNSTAMVLPSFDEGLPVVFMESLALGRPVISTYIAGIPELVETGVDGWVVPAGSLDDLVGAMRDAITSPRQRLVAMGAAGAARVRAQHDSRTEARRLAELFRNAATRS